MTATVFAVDDEPYCLWEHPADTHNLDFLKGIDAEYFSWVAQTVAAQTGREISTEDSQRAATAARIALHQGTETLFSLIVGLLQAPRVLYAWLSKCRTETLREIVGHITSGSFSAPMQLRGPAPTWDLLATFSLERWSGPLEERTAAAKAFGDLWTLLARDFVDPNSAQEYNSLKHGFRVAPGGFTMEMSVPGLEGNEKMMSLGGSAHGVSYFDVRRVGGEQSANRSIRGFQKRRNWDAEQTILLLNLVAASIRNVVSTLQLLSDVAVDKVKFELPSPLEFSAPWQNRNGLLAMTMDRNLPDDYVTATTKQELKDILDKERAGRA